MIKNLAKFGLLATALAILSACTSAGLGDYNPNQWTDVTPAKKGEIIPDGPTDLEGGDDDGGGDTIVLDDGEDPWKPDQVDLGGNEPDAKLNSIVYFAYDQSVVGFSERKKLDKLFKEMESKNFDIKIEGHCDERGSEEYNRALGERRSISVKEYLVALGIAESRIITQSFGEEKPAVEGSTESAYSKNRRAEIYVLIPKELTSKD